MKEPKETKNTKVIPNITPVFNQIPGINAPQIDYNGLKNKPKNSERKYILDIHQLSGTNPTRSFEVVTGGHIGDIYQKYNDINILGDDTMEAHITKISTIGEMPLSLKKGDVVEIKGRVLSNNGVFRIQISAEYRLLHGQTLSISKNNNSCAFVVTKDGTIELKYGDDGLNKFISSIYITIT